jgi:Tfp pilus assembly protein PilO
VRRLLLALFAALLLAVAWWFFLISPRNGDINDAQDQLEAARTQETAIRAQLAQLQEIQDDELLYVDALEELESLVPDEALLDRFIEDLEALADATGVDLQTLSSAPPEQVPESALRVVRISVQLEGRFFDVLGFLFELNDMERLVRVDGLAMTSSTDEAGITSLSVNLDMGLFTLSDLIPSVPDDEEGETGENAGAEGGTDETTEAAGNPSMQTSGFGGG